MLKRASEKEFNHAVRTGTCRAFLPLGRTQGLSWIPWQAVLSRVARLWIHRSQFRSATAACVRETFRSRRADRAAARRRRLPCARTRQHAGDSVQPRLGLALLGGTTIQSTQRFVHPARVFVQPHQPHASQLDGGRTAGCSALSDRRPARAGHAVVRRLVAGFLARWRAGAPVAFEMQRSQADARLAKIFPCARAIGRCDARFIRSFRWSAMSAAVSCISVQRRAEGSVRRFGLVAARPYNPEGMSFIDSVRSRRRPRRWFDQRSRPRALQSRTGALRAGVL